MTLTTTVGIANTTQPQVVQPRMTPEQFAYWLNGFAELNDGERPTAAQWKSITEHLQAVFVKVTPQYWGGVAQAQAIQTLTSRVASQGESVTSLIC